MKTSILYQFFFTIILAVTTTTTGFLADEQTNYVTLQHNKVTCSRNMACKYVICLWERNPTINSDRCTFLDNHCSCPQNMICALTDIVTPRSALLSFQYRCRDPVAIFDNRIDDGDMGNKQSQAGNNFRFNKQR